MAIPSELQHSRFRLGVSARESSTLGLRALDVRHRPGARSQIAVVLHLGVARRLAPGAASLRLRCGLGPKHLGNLPDLGAGGGFAGDRRGACRTDDRRRHAGLAGRVGVKPPRST